MLTNIYKKRIHRQINDFILKNIGIYVIMTIVYERIFMKKGFTLTELMIALAVIGILVAVVTPAIVRTRPNKNKMMVKKTFYVAEQIVNSLINDESLYPDMREACRLNQDNDDDIYCAWGFDYVSKAKFEGAEYEGDYKFAALFKERLNVSEDTGSAETGAGADGENFYPVFYTSDGVKWDLTKTKKAWESKKAKVGKFEDNFNADGTVKSNNAVAGGGIIEVDVNGDEGPGDFCTEDIDDCDKYEIQILANGKLRINPNHKKAVNWATINTSIRDN